MHHFFVDRSSIEGDIIRIEGEDRHHAVDVLRVRTGEELLVSDGEGTDYVCTVTDPGQEELILSVRERLRSDNELSSEVWLFQGMPKSDKLELIIQKATELGVSHIVPVMTKNTVVKLDERKLPQKLSRWSSIAEAAAKQSKRSVIPQIHGPMKLTEALELAEGFEVSVIPYEHEEGIESLCEAITGFIPGRRIGIFIGPEGGFDRLEIKLAEHKGVLPVSLGKRILRTETAAIAVLSLVMIRLEIAESMFNKEE